MIRRLFFSLFLFAFVSCAGARNGAAAVLELFDAPAPDDPLFAQKTDVRNEDAFLKSVLKDGQEETAVEMLNDALAGYRESLKNGVPDKAAFARYMGDRDTVCTACMREILTKNYTESPETSLSSETCQAVLLSDKFQDRQGKAVYRSADGTVFDFAAYYGGDENKAEVVMKVRKDGQTPQQAETKTVYFPMWQPDRVGFFDLNGKLFATNSDPDARHFSVMEFVPEHRYFKDVCTIQSRAFNLNITTGEQDDVCRKILEKNYKTVAPTDAQTALGNKYDLYHQQMCALSVGLQMQNEVHLRRCLNSDGKEAVYTLAEDTTGGAAVISVDYDNNNVSEPLVVAEYNAPGCRYRHLRVYDADARATRLITTGELNGIYRRGKSAGYAISCQGGSQSIVSIDNANYLLTSNADGPERLDAVITQYPNPFPDLEHYCSFAIKRVYQ